MNRWALVSTLTSTSLRKSKCAWMTKWRQVTWQNFTAELERGWISQQSFCLAPCAAASLSLRWYSQHGCWSRQLLAAVSKESPIILISPQRRRQTSHRNISRCQDLLNIEGVLYRRRSGELDILVAHVLLVYLLYWSTQILTELRQDLLRSQVPKGL